ncbi:hypothetical protein [Acuticoccus sp. I52.16.1]|uniref:hypothetical protein n=1 Tax=Acuticoccus sp. I52.16.1 TaxID=2928472 RepID=UPI001FD12E39|nr:hypothetical protein [Acuticoccus sp. I52.16.1]UOM36719.1 hypothetical protein MRB58_11235 [Acuticoccus sp. I52.16.1]
MSLIEKEYFTLGEIEERWSMPRRDLAYLAENSQLRLSVRLFGIAIERAYLEQSPDGGWFDVPYEKTRYSGLMDLLERDVVTLFQEGWVAVNSFYHQDEFIRLIPSAPPVMVKISGVVVRRSERDRAEAELGLSGAQMDTSRCRTCVAAAMLENAAPSSAKPATIVSDNCTEVRIGGIELRLGKIQARVVRHLRAAAQSGHPWRDGKELLKGAGSRSLRMSDVFKSKPGWRELILSDGRGKYRIVSD